MVAAVPQCDACMNKAFGRTQLDPCSVRITTDRGCSFSGGAIRETATPSRIATGGWLIEGTQGPPNLPAYKVTENEVPRRDRGTGFPFPFFSFSGHGGPRLFFGGLVLSLFLFLSFSFYGYQPHHL